MSERLVDHLNQKTRKCSATAILPAAGALASHNFPGGSSTTRIAFMFAWELLVLDHALRDVPLAAKTATREFVGAVSVSAAIMVDVR